MASGRHKAIVEVAGRVEGAEKDLRKLRAELGKLQKQVANTSNKQSVPAKGSLLDAASLTTIVGGVTQAYGAFKEYGDRAFKMSAANKNLAFSISEAQRATKGLASDFELTIAANKAMSLGVAKTDKDFAKLAEAATKLGARVGQGPAESIDNLVDALGKGSTAVLDNLGITLKAGDAQRQYAAQLGKSVGALTDAEKKEAFRVIGLQKALEASQDVTLETENMEGGFKRLTVAVENLIDKTFQLPEIFAEFNKEFRDFSGMSNELDEQQESWFNWGDAATSSVFGVSGALANLRADIFGTADALDLLNEGSVGGALLGKLQAGRIAETRRLQQENVEMLGQAGLGAFNTVKSAALTFMPDYESAGKKKDKRGGRGGGGRRGVASANLGSTAAIDLGTAAMDIGADVSASQIERETAALERQLEIRNMQRETAIEKAASDSERHLLTMTAIEQVRTAEEEIFAKRLEAAELRGEHEEVRAIQHEQEMFRLGMQRETEAELERARREALEAERKRQAERIRMTQEWLGASKSTFNEYAQTYHVFAQAAGASEEARAKAGLRAQGIMTIGEAALSFTRALSATAVGNVPGAIAGFAGAAFGFSRGAVMLAGGVPSAQGGGGGGGGGGPMGTTFAGGATVAPGGTNAPNSRVPGSQSGADSTPRPSSGNGAGTATQVVNVTVNNPIGDIDDEGAEKIGRALNRAGLGVMNG
jgi:hypothetical protein